MKKLIGITSALVAGIAFACSASGPVPAQAPAQASPPAAQAPAPASPPAAQVVKAPTEPTPYKGREGAAALLEAAMGGTLPANGAVLDASPAEVFEGSLDFASSRTVHEPRSVAAGLCGAIEAARGLPSDLAPAAAGTVVATHNAWVVTAAGIENQEVPEWTSVVMGRAAGGDAASTSEAIDLQVSSERRIETIKNPGLFGRIAWWWSR